MYIADSAHNRIRKVSASTHLISTFAGNGNAAYTGDNNPASSATLNSPSGVALDGAGNLYIADTGNNVVRKVTASTGTIITVAGNPAATLLGDNGPATSASLNNPWGVTVDPAGNLFIADTSNHRIRRVDGATGIITTVAGNGFASANGSGAYSGDGGLATQAELNHPFAVAFDAAGTCTSRMRRTIAFAWSTQPERSQPSPATEPSDTRAMAAPPPAQSFGTRPA
jgi:DNA-binding beta-propeller fold protein YncE